LAALEETIYTLLKSGWEKKIFAGATAGITGNVSGMREKTIVSCGDASLVPATIAMKKEAFFDLASLSKPLATTLALFFVF
jgi:hypothetical protein